jgi:hypothetical protein
MPIEQANSAVWAGFALLGALVVAFAVTTIPGVRSSPGFDVRFDGWLQCGGYVVAAAVAVARPVIRSARRRHRPGPTPPGWPAPAPCWWDYGCSAACMPRVGPRRWSWMLWWGA